ncbi:MAG: type II toxin-antitoxin system RelE/ParE family toxin [Opitutales bacterium]|jgi:phage-related protein
MERSELIPVRFFRTEPGNEPVREFLRKELNPEEKKIVGDDIQTVQRCWPIGQPLVDGLGEGLYEVRSRLPNRICRTIFAMFNTKLILLHAFIKKTQKCPSHDKELARRRLRQLKSHEKDQI